jgi:ABC-type nitrate/sulfonate/bicarbonate transport system permease component
MNRKVRKTFSLVGFFLVWEGICYFGLVNPIFLPAPSKIFLTIIKLLQSGELITHTTISLYRAILGFLLAAIIAVPHGILIAWFNTVEDLTNPLVELFRPIPAVALIPVAILWFGIGNLSKIMIIAFACYFPIILNTISGVRQVDVNLLKVAKLFGANRLQTLTKIVLPSAFPSIMTGLRLSLAVSLILLIVTEMIGARSGLGLMIIEAEYTFKTDKMFAGIFTIGFIGFFFNEIMVRVERRLTRWKREIQSISF